MDFFFWEIKTVYVCHKIKDEDIIEGINLKPCPLYAINIEDKTKNKDLLNNKRSILYLSERAKLSLYFMTL